MSPLSLVSIIQPLFLQKISLYILIPNIYSGLGFEFGPQRIRDLAFVCPWSVVSDKHLYSLTLNITLHILLPVYFAMHGERFFETGLNLDEMIFLKHSDE